MGRAPLRPHSKPGWGVGAGTAGRGGKQDLCWEQRDQLAGLGQAWFWTGLGTADFRASLQVNLSFPHHCPAGILWCLTKGCACSGAVFYLFHATYFHKVFALSAVAGLS